jgi:hypothetical protein
MSTSMWPLTDGSTISAETRHIQVDRRTDRPCKVFLACDRMKETENPNNAARDCNNTKCLPVGGSANKKWKRLCCWRLCMAGVSALWLLIRQTECRQWCHERNCEVLLVLRREWNSERVRTSQWVGTINETQTERWRVTHRMGPVIRLVWERVSKENEYLLMGVQCEICER